jgi:NAD(P)-dependent dehydrogenase (short-subunit alcohol dehydrogenase family)
MDFKGSLAVITGAANGIGKASARLLAQKGAQLILVDIDRDRGEALAKELGECAEYIHTDISNGIEVTRLFTRIKDKYDSVDILFNNAGIASSSSLLETEEDEWDRVIKINLKGVFLCSKEAAILMKERKKGVIINTASERGIVGSRNSLSYTAAKGGVVIMTKSMALELAPYGIRCNCVCPGATDTEMLHRDIATTADPKQRIQDIIRLQPLQRIGKPEDVAHAVAFLASDEASQITGIALPVDGGFLAQ